ncbi:MAG: hypothetical protein ACR2RV_23260 [Verrucomicrobiales bacterium]
MHQDGARDMGSSPGDAVQWIGQRIELGLQYLDASTRRPTGETISDKLRTDQLEINYRVGVLRLTGRSTALGS